MTVDLPHRVTGRADLARLADGLLAAVRPYTSSGGARIVLPGTPGGYGTDVDQLEAFARTFLLAGFRLAGEQGHDPAGHAERYARGLVAGTDPTSSERWPRPTEHAQAKVEAASLALVLDLTREWIWDSLSSGEQERVVDYLAEVVGDETYPRSNWLWFRVVVETFLRSVGGPHELSDIRADLELHDSFYERDGWYRDGDERSYDHYVGWAMHLYPTLWSRMSAAEDLAAPRAERDRARLDRFLQDAVDLVDADGAPLVQGRSLAYRFAAAAPFWVGAMAQVPSVPTGRLRATALSCVDHFVQRGVPNARGLLDVGWYGAWRPLAQRYTGPGSPYWASKGLLGLALPAEHPVWTAPVEATPDSDRVRAVAAPAWAVTVPARDGVVRVANHGTDHALPGSSGGDSPLYARLAYSTATAPLLDDDAWLAPVDQSVVLVDAAGRRSHRSGMTPLAVAVEDGTAVASSRAQAHWLTPELGTPNHGSGLPGVAEHAGTVTTVSAVRGSWEVRLVHLADLAPEAVALEAGGWAVADDSGVQVHRHERGVQLSAPRVSADLVALSGWRAERVEHRDGASPLGAHAAVAVLGAPAAPGWYVLALSLDGASASGPAAEEPPAATLSPTHATIAWADGSSTPLELPVPPPVPPASADRTTSTPVPGTIHQ